MVFQIEVADQELLYRTGLQNYVDRNHDDHVFGALNSALQLAENRDPEQNIHWYQNNDVDYEQSQPNRIVQIDTFIDIFYKLIVDVFEQIIEILLL